MEARRYVFVISFIVLKSYKKFVQYLHYNNDALRTREIIGPSPRK